MKIKVKVSTGSSKNEVIQCEDTDPDLRIKLTAPAVDGLANRSLIKLIAGHYAVKQNQVNIISGSKSKIKIIEIL